MKHKRKTVIARYRMYDKDVKRFDSMYRDSKMKWSDFWEQLADEIESKKQRKLL